MKLSEMTPEQKSKRMTHNTGERPVRGNNISQPKIEVVCSDPKQVGSCNSCQDSECKVVLELNLKTIGVRLCRKCAKIAAYELLKYL